MRTNPDKSAFTSSPFILALAACIWLAIRLTYNSLRQLVPDEAYYWVWSRHLAAGYLDHPPMVALVIRAGTALLGNNEFGVRFGATLMMLGAIAILVWLTRRICPDPKAAILAGWILLLSPLAATLGTIITPDTPACFFSMCALATAIVACRRSIYWLAFGLFMGLALDSKYTTVLLGAAVLAAILLTRDGRRELMRPWVWFGFMLCVAVFWPVVSWNRHHDWASFKFQWNHGTGADPSSPTTNIALYLGGQIGIYTPVLLVLGLIALCAKWRHWTSLALADRILLLSATLPLVFFLLSSLRHRPEPNWPIFAYLPMTVILAQWLADGWNTVRLNWARLGIIIAAVMMVIAQLPEIMLLVPNRLVANIPNPWEEMFGWRDCGRALGELSQGAPVFCTSYENASEASFYMPGQPQVWTLDTSRPTEFDYFPGRPDPASLQKLVCVTRAAAQQDIPEELRSFAHTTTQSWQTTALRRTVRKRQFIIAEH